MKVTGPLGYIKRTAKRIKKNHPHITLMQVQHDLANYLGFKKWGDLIKAETYELQRRIELHSLKEL